MTVVIWLLVAAVVIILTVLVLRSSKKPKHQFNGLHDCGLRALLNVVPTLSNDRVEDAFIQCTDNWPNGGIANDEFNLALRHMKIFDLFEYNDTDGQEIEDFTSDPKGTYILLIYGHYTTMKNGRIIDAPHYEHLNPKSVVYCSWKLV